MNSRLVSRRRFLRSSAIAGGALVSGSLLLACDPESERDQLSWLNWQDYIDPETIPDFQTESGITVVYETYASNDELERKLVQATRPRRGGRSGISYDLIVPSDNFVARFERLDIIDELDHDSLGNLDNLAPAFRDAGFDPGNRFSVPWATGTTGIGYDATVFDEPPGYDVFLDEEFAGRATVLNEIRDAFALALFSLGRDPNTRSASDISDAADQLVAMKAVIRGFDSEDYLDLLADGELVAAHAYSSDVLLAKERNPNLEFTLPAEGALRWVDSLAIPVGAPSAANAHRFIDYYLRPEVAARVSEFIQADTGNEAALDLLSDSLRENEVIFPSADVLSSLVFTEDLGDDEDLYVDAWERVEEA
jgi:spermidine/putrescine-binding protein